MKQIFISNFVTPLCTPSAVVGVLMLAACASAPMTVSQPEIASPPQTANQKPHAVNVANEPNTTTATVTSPGYVALKKGDYAQARDYIKVANAETPNDAFHELNLGAAYQETGRMDLAEPLYRQAMTHGHGLRGVDTTTELSKGHTVEEIACQNLAMGLKPATVAGTATLCQTTIVMAISDSPIAFNTYFEFDKASLTPDGQALVADAAKQVLADPKAQINLIGKASRTGTSAHNWTLSRHRAITVRDQLIAQGVPSSRINVRWVGETELAVPQAEGTRQPLNRVVEGSIHK